MVDDTYTRYAELLICLFLSYYWEVRYSAVCTSTSYLKIISLKINYTLSKTAKNTPSRKPTYVKTVLNLRVSTFLITMGKSKNKVSNNFNSGHSGAPPPPVPPSSNKKISPLKVAKK